MIVPESGINDTESGADVCDRFSEIRQFKAISTASNA
jgi:hypothetical protein